jgi:hypothetical protein
LTINEDELPAAFSIERDTPGFIHTDGEVRPCGAQIEVKVLPASLHIAVPAPLRHAPEETTTPATAPFIATPATVA